MIYLPVRRIVLKIMKCNSYETFIGAQLSAMYSVELLQKTKNMSLSKGGMSELYTPYLSIIAFYSASIAYVLVSNPGLDNFSLSWLYNSY